MSYAFGAQVLWTTEPIKKVAVLSLNIPVSHVSGRTRWAETW
jgi:hypothetical protein